MLLGGLEGKRTEFVGFCRIILAISRKTMYNKQGLVFVGYSGSILQQCRRNNGVFSCLLYFYTNGGVYHDLKRML